MSKRKHYSAFADATAWSGNTKRLPKRGNGDGIGGIIIGPEGKLFRCFSEAVGDEYHNSARLEVRAVTRALELMPPDSSIEMHFDYKGIEDRKKQHNRGIINIANSSMEGAFSAMFNAIAEHDEVTLRRRKFQAGKYTEAVHYFARAAAGRAEELEKYKHRLERSLTKDDLGKKEKRRVKNILNAIEEIMSPSFAGVSEAA